MVKIDDKYDKLCNFVKNLERDELYQHVIWYNPETLEFEDSQDDGSWYENESRIRLGKIDLSFPIEYEEDYENFKEYWDDNFEYYINELNIRFY